MMPVQTVAVSDEDIQNIMSLPSLTLSLPYSFGNGGRIDHIVISCACCEAELEPGAIRAEFSQITDGSTASLKGFGLCQACKTITPLEVRFADDGSALCRNSNGWSAQFWGKPQDSNGFLTLTGTFFRRNWKEILPPILVLALFLTWQYVVYV